MKEFHRIFRFILILLSGVATLHAQNTMVIRSISIEQHPVFDTTADIRWIERTANSVHSNAKEFVIRREILFHENDTLKQAALDETERNLRRLGIFGDIEVRKNVVNDSLVDITVVVHEKWTLYPVAYVTREGGITGYGASIDESNFAGLGQSLGVSYDYLSSRKKPEGFSAYYRITRLFDSEWESLLRYKNSEDLKLRAVQIDKPFYTETSTWSGGVYADNGTVRALHYTDGMLTTEKFFDFHSQYLWGEYSMNDNETKLRFGTAFIRQRYPTDTLFSSLSLHLTQVNFSTGWVRRSYRKETFFDNLGTTEDVPIGCAASLVIGKDIQRRDLLFLLLRGQIAFCINGAYAGEFVNIQGYRTDSTFSDATLSLGSTFTTRTHSVGVFAANVSGTFGINWNPGWQTFLDSRNLLRGIPAYALSGNRRVIINLEERVMHDITIWFFRMGSVFFFDGGAIWNQGDNYLKSHFYKSVGYGIRIGNEKLQGMGIMRLDFAYNFDRKNFELILSLGQLFTAFGGVDTASPLSF